MQNVNKTHYPRSDHNHRAACSCGWIGEVEYNPVLRTASQLHDWWTNHFSKMDPAVSTSVKVPSQ